MKSYSKLCIHQCGGVSILATEALFVRMGLIVACSRESRRSGARPERGPGSLQCLPQWIDSAIDPMLKGIINGKTHEVYEAFGFRVAMAGCRAVETCDGTVHTPKMPSANRLFFFSAALTRGFDCCMSCRYYRGHQHSPRQFAR